MKKCECYFEQERPVFQYGNFTSGYSRATGLTTTVGYCNGTKERDICNCKGDRCKCDFYPEVRAKAQQEEHIEDKRKGNERAADILKFCLTSQERDGMVYIPKRILEKIIEALG